MAAAEYGYSQIFAVDEREASVSDAERRNYGQNTVGTDGDCFDISDIHGSGTGFLRCKLRVRFSCACGVATIYTYYFFVADTSVKQKTNSAWARSLAPRQHHLTAPPVLAFGD